MVLFLVLAIAFLGYGDNENSVRAMHYGFIIGAEGEFLFRSSFLTIPTIIPCFAAELKWLFPSLQLLTLEPSLMWGWRSLPTQQASHPPLISTTESGILPDSTCISILRLLYTCLHSVLLLHLEYLYIHKFCLFLYRLPRSYKSFNLK